MGSAALVAAVPSRRISCTRLRSNLIRIKEVIEIYIRDRGDGEWSVGWGFKNDLLCKRR